MKMLRNSRLAYAAMPFGLALIVAGLLLGRWAHGPLFGISTDLLSGLMSGAGIGIVLMSVVAGVGTRQT
ncbi:hypothetical protein [Brevundimonas sp. SL161]|uniref:hypothetical protein n=1 Tax=Brevundimonas sp. SL161 TaxID=2804613 RepID=UPI003CF64681